MNASSYTAAGTMPIKLMKRAGQAVVDGKIAPVHVQISPTNRCNLACSFCSCANREHAAEMPVDTFIDIVSEFAKAGCKAVTITGGGEPTLHPSINEMIAFCRSLGIETGLVSNGLALNRLSTEAINALTWCRISFSDDREFDAKFVQRVVDFRNEGRGVDLAFSYVLTAHPNYENLSGIIELGNDLDATHIRIVTDLLDLESVPEMADIRTALLSMGVRDQRVIYQGRKEYAHGRKRCLISLLKPVIAADGGWYPCCGVQYALPEHGLDFEVSMCMGTAIKEIIAAQRPFDGSVCSRCYYDDYNVMLDMMTRPVDHEAFV